MNRNENYLSLASTKVVSTFGNHLHKLIRETLHMVKHADATEDFPNLLIGELVERIKVEANSSRKHDRVLGDNAKLRTKSAQRNSANVDTIDKDATRSQGLDAEQSDHETTLSTAKKNIYFLTKERE